MNDKLRHELGLLKDKLDKIDRGNLSVIDDERLADVRYRLVLIDGRLNGAEYYHE